MFWVQQGKLNSNSLKILKGMTLVIPFFMEFSKPITRSEYFFLTLFSFPKSLEGISNRKGEISQIG